MTITEYRHLVDNYKSEHEWLDYRAALICTVIANAFRDPKRKPQPFSPTDFMPTRERVKRQTAEEMLATVNLLNAAFGGTICEN